jgi:hypothetical protein
MHARGMQLRTKANSLPQKSAMAPSDIEGHSSSAFSEERPPSQPPTLNHIMIIASFLFSSQTDV